VVCSERCVDVASEVIEPSVLAEMFERLPQNLDLSFARPDGKATDAQPTSRRDGSHKPPADP
jgi:hypothetical protein